MRRREFVSLLGGAGAALLTWPLATLAQPAERVRRVGVLLPILDEDAVHRPRIVAFRQRLQALGWTEGRNLQLVVRFSGGDAERIRISAAEVVAGLPDVIVSSTSTAARALVDATREIP